MKEAAQFFLDYLVDDGKGHLVTGPSLSPENTYRTASGERAVLTMGPTMDTEILQQFFGRLIEASDILKIDPDFRAKVEAARAKLNPLKIGKWGQILEWPEDYDEAEPGHRHISQLFALFPGDLITPHKTPELATGRPRHHRAPAGERGRRHRLEPRLDHQLLDTAGRWREGLSKI